MKSIVKRKKLHFFLSKENITNQKFSTMSNKTSMYSLIKNTFSANLMYASCFVLAFLFTTSELNAQISCADSIGLTIPQTGSIRSNGSRTGDLCDCDNGFSPNGYCKLITLDLSNIVVGECILANARSNGGGPMRYIDANDCSILGSGNGNIFLDPNLTQVFVCKDGNVNMEIDWEFSTSGSCGAVACDIDITLVTPTNESCPGADDGTVTVTSNCVGCDGGANPGRDYTLYEQGTNNVVATIINEPFDAVFSNLPPGDYTVEVVDGGGTVNVCSDTEDFSIVAATQPTLSVSDISGSQICDGTDVNPIAVIGGTTGTVTYNWVAPGGSQSSIDDASSANPTITLDGGDASNLSFVETWTLEITDDNCTVSTTFDITAFASPLDVITSVTHVDATCAAISNGSITVNFLPQAGRTNIQFSIDGGANYVSLTVGSSPYTFTGLSEGVYQLMVKWGNDDCEFVVPGNINLGSPEVTLDNVFVTNESCGGANDGQIIIVGNVPGGNPTQYRIPQLSGALNNWRSDNTYPNLAPGTYTVQVRNQNTPQCIASGTAVVYAGVSQGAPTPIDASYACTIGGTRLRATCDACSDFTIFEDDFDPSPLAGYSFNNAVISDCVSGIDNVIGFNDNNESIVLPGTYDFSNLNAEYFFMFDFYNVTGCPGGGQGETTDNLEFEYSTDGGVNWTSFFTHSVNDGTGPNQMSNPIPGDAAWNAIMIRIRTNQGPQDNLQLDNLKIFATPDNPSKAWYNVPSGGTAISNANNLNPNNQSGEVVVAGSNGGTVGAIEPFDVSNEGAVYRFYVECLCAGCPSTRVAVDATVNMCCDIDFDAVFVDNESCDGSNDGGVTIDASTPGNLFDINYEIVGPMGAIGPQLNDGVFNNLADGLYNINLIRADDPSCMVTGNFVVEQGQVVSAPLSTTPVNMECEGVIPQLTASCTDPCEEITVFQDDFGLMDNEYKTGWDFQRASMINDCRAAIFGPGAGYGLYFDNNDDDAFLPGSYDFDFDKYDYFISFDYWNNGFAGCRDNAASVSENADNLRFQSSIDGVTFTNRYSQSLGSDGNVVNQPIFAGLTGQQTLILRFIFNANSNPNDDAFMDNLSITAVSKNPADITWYDAPVGGNLLFTGSMYTPSNGDAGFSSSTEGTYSFYAECNCAMCPSSRTQVDIAVGSCCEPDAGTLSSTLDECYSICNDGGAAELISVDVFDRTQPTNPLNYEYDLAVVSSSTGLIVQVIAVGGSPVNGTTLADAIDPSTYAAGDYTIHPVNWLGTETLSPALAMGSDFSDFAMQFDYNNGDEAQGPGTICGDVQTNSALSFTVLDPIVATATAVCTSDGTNPAGPNEFYIEVTDVSGGNNGDYTISGSGFPDVTFNGSTLYIGPFSILTNTVTLTIEDDNSGNAPDCRDCSAMQDVDFVTTPQVVLMGSPMTICPGGDYSVSVSVDNAKGPFTLNFTSSIGMVSRSNVSNGDVLTFTEGVDFNGADATDLSLTSVVDSDGCERVQNIDLSVGLFDQPTVSINAASFTEVCLGQAINLSAVASNGTGPYTYIWSVTGGNGSASLISDMDTVTVIGTGTGTVDVTVVVMDANGCTSATATQTITVTDDCPGFRILDPCSCNDDADVNGSNGTFAETVSISGVDSLPGGQSWQVVSIVGGYVDNGATPGPGAVLDASSIILLSYNMMEGTYEYSFAHVDAQGYTITVQGPNPDTDGDHTTIEPGNEVFTITNTCFYPNPVLVASNVICEDEPSFFIEVQNVDTTGATVSWAYDSDNDPSTDNATPSGSVSWLSDEGEINPQDGSFPLDQIITIEYEFDAADAPGTSSPGCVKTVSISFVSRPNLSISGVVTDETCDDNNGAIDITVTGGDGSYTYEWSSGELTEDLSSLSSGFYTIVVSDTTACSATATFQVLDVEDTEGPQLTCPGPISRVNTPNECYYEFTGPAANASVIGDNCTALPGITLTHDFAPAPSNTTLVGAQFPIGTTTVIWTATDEYGNESTCSVDITVSDTEVPVLTCTDVNRVISLGECDYTFTGSAADVIVTDNCTFTATHNYPAPSTSTLSGATFPIGTTSVFWVVVDEGGNEVTCVRNVIVTDNVDPMLTCASDQTIPVDAGTCSATLADSADPLIASDNCDFTLVHNYINAPLDSTLAGSVLPLGTTVVTWTITDLSGNDMMCDVSITVEDNEAPQFVNCFSDTLTVGNDVNNCNAGVIWSIPIADDNCSVDTVEQTIGLPPGSILPIGFTTIQYVASDEAGLTDTCTFVIEVIDTQDPLLICPSDMTVSADMGACSWTSPLNSLNPLTAIENCEAELRYTIDDAAGVMTNDSGFVMPYVFPLGTSEICYSLADSSGMQVANCCFMLTVTDTEGPVITCPTDTVVECDGSGNTGDLATFFSGLSATDNCLAPITFDTLVFNTISGCGGSSTTTYQFTATDSLGNSSICFADFTIEDTTAPVITPSTPALTDVECDGSGNSNALNAWLASNGGIPNSDVSEICGNYTWSNDFGPLSEDIPAGGCDAMDALATYTVNFWTVDECGNISNLVERTFRIVDSTPPSLTVPSDLSVNCNDVLNESIISNWLNSYQADDSCSNATVTNDYLAANLPTTCNESLIVRFTAVDICGNAVIDSATISVLDTLKPVIMVPPSDLFLECDGMMNATEITNWVAANGNLVAVDVCDSSLTITATPGTPTVVCVGQSTTPYTFTIEDDCGNSISEIAYVNIIDITPPNIDTPASDSLVQCDGAGNLTELQGWLASNGGASATDVCSSVTWTYELIQESDLCSATGSGLYRFTATDDCGNTSVTQASFEIVDTIDPVLTEPVDIVLDCDDISGTSDPAAIDRFINSSGYC